MCLEHVAKMYAPQWQHINANFDAELQLDYFREIPVTTSVSRYLSVQA